MLCYMQHTAPVKASAWSDDGAFLATVTVLGTVHIYDSRTFRSNLVNVQIASFRDVDEPEVDEVFYPFFLFIYFFALSPLSLVFLLL
jgi:hypothetical protein